LRGRVRSEIVVIEIGSIGAGEDGGEPIATINYDCAFVMLAESGDVIDEVAF
jgi:hypothetical protein